MRTRMVPFQRHVPRLTRLVRQSAAESGKRAELAVEGASGELDRQVLDKMLPPFEHMMRNAVVHGLEDPDTRQAAGKPAAGRITIRLHREGAEMVIDVADDGAGLDVARGTRSRDSRARAHILSRNPAATFQRATFCQARARHDRGPRQTPGRCARSARPNPTAADADPTGSGGSDHGR